MFQPRRASIVRPHSTPVDIITITTTNDVGDVTEKLIDPADDPIINVNGNTNKLSILLICSPTNADMSNLSRGRKRTRTFFNSIKRKISGKHCVR